MKNKISHILVPVDFSDSSLNAVETATAIAKKNDAKITLLNVVDTSFLFGFKGVHYVSENTIDVIVDISSQRLNQLVKHISEKNAMNYKAQVKLGLVAQAINNAAVETKSDMIIMGTHGISGFREFFIGSTAQNVIKVASCPVLTIPVNGKWTKFRKVLLPLRPIAGAEEKYDSIKPLLNDSNASLHVIALAEVYNREEKTSLKSLLKLLKAKTLKDRIKISGTLKVGKKMPQAVLKMLKYVLPELVVLTSSPGSHLKQFFIGPFEQHILNHSTVPVLCVKAKKAESNLSVVIQQVNESFPSSLAV